MNTNCSKCGAPMPPTPKPTVDSPLNFARFIITAYRCEQCGHWNDLKRRKGWKVREMDERKV